MTTYSWNTAAATDTKSGTGWTIDVTACNLSTDLTEKDFVVLFDDVSQSVADFTKTTSTTLTYTGSSIPSTSVEVRRSTPEDPYRLINYRDQFSSDDWNRELERISRRQVEINTFGVNSVGDLDGTVRDDAYSGSWNSDIANAATRNALYDKFEAMEDAYQADDTALQANIDLKAPLASPTFTGVVTVPTASADDNTTKAASTAYVQTELADYAPLASPVFTGTPTAPTPVVDTNNTSIATTAYTITQINQEISDQIAGTYAPLASPTFTGTPAAPTAALNTDTTQVATTAYVMAAKPQFTLLEDQKSSGTNGGARPSAGFFTRTLNTEVIDEIGVTLSSNEFTLPGATKPGRYKISWSAPGFYCDQFQTRLYSVTGAASVKVGTPEFSDYSATGTFTQARSFGKTIVDISADTVYRIEQNNNITNANGNELGVARGVTTEVYTMVEIEYLGD